MREGESEIRANNLFTQFFHSGDKCIAKFFRIRTSKQRLAERQAQIHVMKRRAKLFRSPNVGPLGIAFLIRIAHWSKKKKKKTNQDSAKDWVFLRFCVFLEE